MLVKFLKFILATVLLTIIAIVGFYYYLKSIYLQEFIDTPKTVFIPKGSTKSALLVLKKSGIEIGDLDYYIVKMIGYPQAGWIDLGSTRMKRGEFFIRITKSKAAVKDITLIPGETKEIFFKELSDKFDLNVTKLNTIYEKTAPYPDGVIFAETYTLPVGISEKDTIEYLINHSLKEHKKLSEKFLNSYDQKEWFEKYITIASIITKEAGNSNEMPLVSAVIYNRLKKGMLLQMDGTLNNRYRSHQKVTPKMIREDDSKFNTYKQKGLPPYPICSVTEESISAAINPASVNYLYFVRSSKGKHVFANSYKEHLRNIKKYSKR